MKRFHYDEDKGTLLELGEDEQAPFSGKVVSESEAADIKAQHLKAFDDAGDRIVQAKEAVVAALKSLGVDDADARIALGLPES